MPKTLTIFGPPGCGKTHRMIAEMEQALADGVRPWEICFVSFTRKGVYEALERACAKFGLLPKDLPYVKTLHALAFHGLGVTRNDMMSAADYAIVGNKLGVAFNGMEAVSPDDGVLLPSVGGNAIHYLRVIDKARYRMVSLESEYNREGNYSLSFPKLRQIDQSLKAYKSTFGKMDFVDLIDLYPKTVDIPRFKLFIVDEAQDLTPLQWAMARAIKDRSERVIYAGDDDQAIHAWTAVEVQQFMDASDNFEILSQSYRVPRVVHEVANKIVNRIRNRVPKDYYPTDKEGSYTHHMTIDTIPFESGSWTVMARTNSALTMFREWFETSGYLYSVKGHPSLRVKLAEAIKSWRILQENGSLDISSIRNLYENLPKQGSGTALRRGSGVLLDAADPMGQYSYEDLVREFGLLASKDQGALSVIKMTDDERLYIAALERRGEDIFSEPRIKLSTMHSMKGGEDDNCVVYLGTTQACVNSPNQDDEHRVFYVGVTRTRDNLHILDTDRKYRYDI